MKTLDKLLSLLVPGLILVHLLCAPYTKVEESFTIQATHDILTYGIPISNVNQTLRAEYDHLTFPGAVPRTFTGALALAALSKAWAGTGQGRQVAGTLAMEKLLPVPSALTSRETDRKRCKLAIYLLAFTGVVFRSEIAIFLAAHTAYIWARGRVSIWKDIVPAGLTGTLMGLLVTVSVDSFFWQRLLWPELAGFYYNAIEGNSVAWGTSPWHFYFTNALPRLLLNPLSWQLCIPLAIGLKATRQRSVDIIIPLIAFVAIYSFQPHKEWRFVLYVIPGLTAVSAIGADWVWARRSKSIIYGFLSLCLIGSIAACFIASAGFLAISQLNYPGAVALNRLHELADGSEKVIKVHMDTLSCTSGVTRFLEKPKPPSLVEQDTTLWQYDKTEDQETLLTPAFWADFDYALTEEPQTVIGKWELIDQVYGYAGLRIANLGGSSKGARQQPLDSSTPRLQRWLEELFFLIPPAIRTSIFRDRWIQIRMEPAIRILKRQPASPPIAAP
ncbi:MAG: hypothetical protein M4579_001921 [Chaenotheca gracillima]|nr:MAG: hypothetical protein M4579_001921 [Chaenotheca gracillima]